MATRHVIRRKESYPNRKVPMGRFHNLQRGQEVQYFRPDDGGYPHAVATGQSRLINRGRASDIAWELIDRDGWSRWVDWRKIFLIRAPR